MRVLLACEESQAVCKEFRERGHEAYSCDLLPCSGDHPEWHLQLDVTQLLKQKWDLIIAFPPCTYLTVTGNRWFNVERYGEKAIQRMKDREDGINFFMMFANSDCERVVIENPVGIMSSVWKKPSQIINPYQFGDPFEKKTCLWIKGLPNLVPTDVVQPPPRKVYASGKSMPAWYCEAWGKPKAERSTLRSKTFPGIARAMADQWGSVQI
jgi:hypothetical protein